MASAQPDTAAQTGQLIEHLMGYAYSASLYAVTRIGVADHFADGPKTAEELAERTGVHGPYLKRVLRYLSTREVFREDDKGLFHLTPLAELLRSDDPNSLRDSFLMLADDVFWTPAGRLYETLQKGSTVFDDIYGDPFFVHLSKHADKAKTFDVGTNTLSSRLTEDIAVSYDFPAGAKVVDVGGGRGGLLRAVLSKNPEITGVLYDQDYTVGRNVLDVPELEGRWSAEAGNFLESVPAGADFYLLKAILHDWNDENGLLILKAIRRNMAEGARVLAIDAVLPEGNVPHPGWTIDVMMMASFNGKERTHAEFEELLLEAGFKIARILPTPSYVSIVEAIAA